MCLDRKMLIAIFVLLTVSRVRTVIVLKSVGGKAIIAQNYWWLLLVHAHERCPRCINSLQKYQLSFFSNTIQYHTKAHFWTNSVGLSLIQLCIQLSLSLSLCRRHFLPVEQLHTYFNVTGSTFLWTLLAVWPPSLLVHTLHMQRSFCGRHGPWGVHLHVFVWKSFALDSCAVFSQEDAGKLEVRLSSPRVRCRHSSISVKDPNSLL